MINRDLYLFVPLHRRPIKVLFHAHIGALRLQVTCPKSSHNREGPVVNSFSGRADREGSSMRHFPRDALLAAEGEEYITSGLWIDRSRRLQHAGCVGYSHLGASFNSMRISPYSAWRIAPATLFACAPIVREGLVPSSKNGPAGSDTGATG